MIEQGLNLESYLLQSCLLAVALRARTVREHLQAAASE